MGQTYVADKDALRDKWEELEARWEELGDARCELIREVVTSIFPISEEGSGASSLAL
jgi:hypothetical protein